MADPRAALAVLVNAFERHLEACAQRRGEDDPNVLAAYDDLADAFEAYDDALLDSYGEMTPFDVVTEPEEEDDLDEDDSTIVMSAWTTRSSTTWTRTTSMTPRTTPRTTIPTVPIRTPRTMTTTRSLGPDATSSEFPWSAVSL